MDKNQNTPESRCEKDGIVYYRRPDVAVDGVVYQRWAIQTHFVERGESYIELVERYVKPLIQPGDILSMAEKIISMCQNHVVERKDIKVGFWARLMWRFAYHSPHGQGIHVPHKVQLAINIAGLPRFLLACFCGAVGKLIGRRGWFYKVIGHDIAGIDGLYAESVFPAYRDLALLIPREPDKVCAEVEGVLGIPALCVDANYLTLDILGTSPGVTLPHDTLSAVLKDNPSGQYVERTPLIIIRPGGGAHESENQGN